VSSIPPPTIHPRAERRLQGVVASGRWAPAYLLAGSGGSGVRRTADYLAQAILCADPAPPCGECLACRKFTHGNHPALYRSPDFAVVKEKVDTARAVIEHLALRPYEGEHQVVIVPGADCFNPAAGNALLKTLEEPPGQAVLILLARHLTAVLPTIRSRCQVLRLPVPELDLLQAEGEMAGLSPTQARLQARIAAAQTGDLSALAVDEVAEHVAACFALWEHIVRREGTPLLAWVEEHLKGQDKEATAAWLSAWLTTFGLWLRDAMLVAWGDDPARLTFPEVGQRLAAGSLPEPGFFEKAAGRLAAAYRELAANAQPRLVAGNLLLGLQDDLARSRVSGYHGRSASRGANPAALRS